MKRLKWTYMSDNIRENCFFDIYVEEVGDNEWAYIRAGFSTSRESRKDENLLSQYMTDKLDVASEITLE